MTPPSLDLRPAEEESRRIAALFGWKAGAARVPASAAGAAPAGPPAAEEPADADWLKPFGFVVGQEGERTYVFKDSRSGNVLSLLPGGESRGWKLLEVGAGGYILEHEGRRYRVK